MRKTCGRRNDGTWCIELSSDCRLLINRSVFLSWLDGNHDKSLINSGDINVEWGFVAADEAPESSPSIQINRVARCSGRYFSRVAFYPYVPLGRVFLDLARVFRVFRLYE